MSYQAPTPLTEREKFYRYRLPLILIFFALAIFNVLLYALLTSDNPRPDLAEEATSAEVATEPIVNQTVLGDGVALMPANGDLDGSGWQAISGNWIAEGNVLRQTSLADFDQSIVYTPRTFDTYAFDVTVQHYNDNIGGGILFNMQRTDSIAGSHLVRFEVDGSGIYWGTFAEDGSFEGNGFASISIDPLQPNRLMVQSHATTYDILLNETVIAQDIPLTWTSGHVGMAVSQSDAAYSNIMVWPIDGIGTLAPESQSLLAQSESISGEWVYTDGVIQQISNESTDYMTALNVLGRTYTVEATINMALEGTPEDSGGGFIFHMADRADRAGATMVRFIDQGERIVWGQYDQAGVFQGAGNIALDLTGEEPIHLSVRVRNGSYDLLVNDELVISELPLAVEEGWLGLVAFRGVVEFSDVRLNIGE